jgi:hypothetical protein
MINEDIVYSEAIDAYLKHLEDTSILTEAKKYYLLKIAEEFEDLPEPSRSINIISGVGFINGYMEAIKSLQKKRTEGI